ncbi:MAG: DUF4910 domain-containing protein [Desulfatibacillum sp.]|nr:DUF4910 domain-containing protein [Desulfatibacillum sp.]
MHNKWKFDFKPSFDLAIPGEDLAHDPEVAGVMDICRDLHILDRTLVSDDYDKALDYLGNILPMKVHAVKSGAEVFTWKVPKKWVVNEAYIKDADGKTIADFFLHPLYLSSYSIPFRGDLDKQELLKHVVTNPDRPAAIPYHYHYYKEDWSFCLPYNVVKGLGEGPYNVVVDTRFESGEMKVGEWVVPGQSRESILLSAHLCHPGQVNDGLAGVALGLMLMKWLASSPASHFTYRLITHPENIGSLCYFYKNRHLIPDFKGAVFLEMLGNRNHLKIQYSRQGNTVIDQLMELAVAHNEKPYGVGAFRKVICNDEININGPGINIPCISLTRWPYPEYHTSDDSPDIISMGMIKESLDTCKRFINMLETNWYPARKYTGNLFLSKYGLYEDLNKDDAIEQILLAFEGDKSVLEISQDLDLSFDRVAKYARRFYEKGLVDLNYSPIYREREGSCPEPSKNRLNRQGVIDLDMEDS